MFSFSEEMTEIDRIILCTRRSRSTYLADNIFVRHANNETILGCVVLVLVLVDERMTSVEVSFAL